MRWFFRLGPARRAGVLVLFGTLLALGGASAIELLDAELVAAGSPVLQNASGTVRLEQGRLDAVGRRVFVVPEPGVLWRWARESDSWRSSLGAADAAPATPRRRVP